MSATDSNQALHEKAPLDPNQPVLECKGLSISYYTRAGEIPAVIDFNLKLYPGEAVGIVGESGCGKSTVAMAIMQYMGSNGGITGGEILFKGRDMTQMSDGELQHLRGNDIAMIYQEPMSALNPSMAIGRQLMEVPLFHDDASEQEAYDRSKAMLEKVNLPDPERVMKAYPHEISGGQQQRVVIAMALLSNPTLLLLDEPTTALDVTVEAGIVKLVKEISKQTGTSMIYISHNMGLIKETCDRICVMYSGIAVETGTVGEVFDNMRHPYTRGLFGSIPLPTADKLAAPLKSIPGQLPLPYERPSGCYFGPRCDFFEAGRCDNPDNIKSRTVDQETKHDVRCCRYDEIDWARDVKPAEQAEANEIGEEVLSIDNMQKYYEVRQNTLAAMLSGEESTFVKANESINFTARKSETVAIVGESGCGKSTLAKVLMGLETVTGGSVSFLDKDIGQVKVTDRTPAEIGALQMIFQNPNETLNPSHTIGGQISRVIRKFGNLNSEDEVQARVDELLDLVKLPRIFKYRKPRQLSGGQKQRIGIARAFAGSPKMVIADEPVSALDVSVQAAVTSLLMDIQREFETTLLFISHDLSVVRYLADRVVVMYLGQIMEQGTVDQVYNPPYHPYTEALLSAVPIADMAVEKREIVLEGNLPSVMNPPKGCPFSTRCHRRIGQICDDERPPVIAVEEGHQIACHIPLAELQKVQPVIKLPNNPPSIEQGDQKSAEALAENAK
ncbi:MAG: dipeptide ABC transporter ATP-binding protein [Alphaproteobacteria bacterium]